MCGKTGFRTLRVARQRAAWRNIAESFRDGCDSVILENHGVVVGGGRCPRRFNGSRRSSLRRRHVIKGRHLGDVRYLSEAQLEQARDRSVALESFDPPLATADEQELRRQLSAFLRRGCRQRLLISTEGSFSARLGDDAFLITPTQRDRESLDIADFVLFRAISARPARRPAARFSPIKPSTENTRMSVQSCSPIRSTRLLSA